MISSMERNELAWEEPVQCQFMQHKLHTDFTGPQNTATKPIHIGRYRNVFQKSNSTLYWYHNVQVCVYQLTFSQLCLLDIWFHFILHTCLASRVVYLNFSAFSVLSPLACLKEFLPYLLELRRKRNVFMCQACLCHSACLHISLMSTHIRDSESAVRRHNVFDFTQKKKPRNEILCVKSEIQTALQIYIVAFWYSVKSGRRVPASRRKVLFPCSG
jgi:hypothetical protein